MDKQHCIINPKTNRAVKIDSKLGKQILASQKDVKKEPHTQYKKAIGPKVENIPRILRKTNYTGTAQTNKILDTQYKAITTKKADGSISMQRAVDTKKSEMKDNMFWRKNLSTKEEINKMSPKTLIMNIMELLGNIDAHVKLNVKLDKDDEANFNALYPTIELLLDQIDKLNVNAEDFTSSKYEQYKKNYNKYMKLRKKIKGQEIKKLKETVEPHTMYKSSSVVMPNRNTLNANVPITTQVDNLLNKLSLPPQYRRRTRRR